MAEHEIGTRVLIALGVNYKNQTMTMIGEGTYEGYLPHPDWGNLPMVALKDERGDLWYGCEVWWSTDIEKMQSLINNSIKTYDLKTVYITRDEFKSRTFDERTEAHAITSE